VSSHPPTTQANAGEGAGGFGIGLVSRGMRRYPFITLLFLLLAGGAAAAIWFFLPLPKMTAYAVLQIKSEPDYIVKADNGSQGEFNMYRQSQSALVKSRPVLSAAMNSYPDVAKTLRKRGIDPVPWLDGNLKVDFKLGPELMRVSLEGNNEEELKEIVTAVTDHYLKDVVNKDRSRRLARLEQLKKVYRNLEETLVKQRKEIGAYAESVGSGEPQTVAVQEKYRQEMIGIFERDLVQLERDLMRLKSEEKGIKGRVEKGAKDYIVPLESVNAVLNADPIYRAFLERQNKIQAGIDNLSNSLAPGVTHPAIAVKEKEFALVKEEANKYAAKERPGIEAKLRENALLRERQLLDETSKRVEGMLDLRKELDAQLDRMEKKDKKFKKDQFGLEITKSQLVQYERSADRIFQEMEALRPEMDVSPRVLPWEEASVMPGIEGNRRLKYSALAGLAVLVVGLGLVTALEYRNRRVVALGEVVAGLGLRVIGTVPSLPRKALARGREPIPSRAPEWQLRLAECVDNARTMLIHGSGSASPVHTILITSALSGEGKTSLAGHLAVSLARAGFRTLLVDADMRRPSLHRILGLPREGGLSELLRGEITLDEALCPTPAYGLFALPAGKWHPTLPRALAGNAWPALKAKLEAEFDYVIVDTPPLLPVADTLLMARHADGVVLSLLHDVSRLGAVAEAKDRLAAVGTNVLGVVINGVVGGAYGASFTDHLYYSAATRA
jgi:succinoglycan biosynthesis transport protein ExoP